MTQAKMTSGWTDKRKSLLAKYWTDGKTAREIAGLLGGGVTRNGIIAKAHRMGLPGRGSPIGAGKVKQKIDANRRANAGRRAAQPPRPDFWTPERIAILENGYSAESVMPIAEIAAAVGCSEGRIYAKAREKGLVHPNRAQRSDGRPGGIVTSITRTMSERLADRAPRSAPDSLDVAMADLTPKQCRFSTSPHMARGHTFCGAEIAAPGLPYCRYHHAIAFRPLSGANDDAPAAQAAE